MRTITIPSGVLERAVHGPILGTHLEFLVCVDWPELRLTEDQMMANAIAFLNGDELPFPDPSIFSVSVPYLPSAALAQNEKTA